MSKTSSLYPLIPQGISGKNIESLGHYIVCLAHKHQVAPKALIFELVFQIAGKINKKRNNQNLQSIGGNCDLTKEVVDILSTLTGCQDIELTTFTHYDHIVSNTGLFKENNAWCGKCYSNPDTSYDSLLKLFKPIKLCPIHLDLLTELCPYSDCQQSFPTLSLHRVPGYCPHCKRSLRYAELYKSESLEGLDLTYQKWVIQNLGDLIENSGKSKLYSKENISHAIDIYVTKFTNRSRSEFNRRIKSKDVEAILADDRRINITLLLAIALELNVSLLELLSGKAMDVLNNRTLDPDMAYTSIRPGDVDPEYLKKELQKYAEDKEITAIKKVALALNVSLDSLHEHCPDEYQAIINKNKRVKVLDKDNIGSILQDIIDAPATPPSAEVIAKEVGCSYTFLRKNFPEECSKIRFRRQRDPLKKHRRRKTPSEIREAFIEILNKSSKKPPPQLYIIAKEIGCTQKTLMKSCPDLANDVELKIKEYEMNEKENLRNTLELYPTRNPPISLTRVAVFLNVEEQKLRRLFPNICNRIVQHYESRSNNELVREALELALVVDPAPTVESISFELNVPAGTIKNKFPDLYQKVISRHTS